MIIGAIITIGLWSLQNYLGLDFGIYILSAVVIIGGIAIAIYNALKLNTGSDGDMAP